MKDFIKWLGVNEKIAKVVVWFFIFAIMLILTNTMLNSLGFPHYQINYNNLKNIDYGEVLNLLSKVVVCMLNFYTIVLLIFRIKEYKKLFKWCVIYLIINWIISDLFGYIATQIFILIFFLLFPYFYSNKNKKYILYGFFALVFNTIVEAVTYYFKASSIDITSISRVTRAFLFTDYFIIMGIIILVKEIYLKKRGEVK